MIGTGLRLNHKPDGSVFGWDEDQTASWARLVERRWEIWASQPYECDAAGRYTMAQMEAAAVRQWIGTGEVVASIREIARPGAETKPPVRLLPSHRLSQNSDGMNRLDHGVYTDANGLPVDTCSTCRPAHYRREVRTRATLRARASHVRRCRRAGLHHAAGAGAQDRAPVRPAG